MMDGPSVRGDAMTNVLAPVRPDRDTDWAVAFLVKLHQRERILVHLLSVQVPYNGHVGMFFSAGQLRAFQREDAERELEPMRRALHAAGVPCESHIVVGRVAEEIAKFAQDHDCHQIVMGPVRGRARSGFILGSLTHQVEHLMRMAGQTCEVL
jgi:nucleotide-binding universal stress UspA family protein